MNLEDFINSVPEMSDDRQNGHKRPTITLHGTLHEKASAVAAAISRNNDPPHLFRRYREFVRVVFDGEIPMIEPIDHRTLRVHLSDRYAIKGLRKNRETGDFDLVDTDLPLEVADYLSRREEIDLPELIGAATAPTFSKDGSFVSSRGYNAHLRIFMGLSSGVRPPESPSGDDIRQARDFLLNEALGDFPFVDDASKAHAIAFALLPMVRGLIDGPTPLHLVTATAPGSGKSLLAMALSLIGSYLVPPPITLPKDDDETRKLLGSTLATGPEVIFIDNVDRMLKSTALASALTSDPWSTRLVGQPRNTILPVRCSWIATGNNILASNEMARRIVPIKLDARHERPWLRSGFRHEHLLSWITEHRNDLTVALATLVRAWFDRGMPPGTTFGSYPSWARVIGGILQVGEITGFLGNIEEFYQQGDLEGSDWRAFVEVWRQQHGESTMTVGELYRLASERDLLGSILGDGTERAQRTRLGHALRRVEGRVFSGHRISRSGVESRTRTPMWALEPVGEP